MANDKETMRARLRTQVFDVDDDTWNAGEKDDVLLWAVRRLNQRLNRPLDPEAATQKITLVADDYFYSIDTGITNISKVEFLDTDSDELGELQAGWEIVGDLVAGNAKMHVAPSIVEQGGYLRLTAYGRYELATQGSSQTTAIPDDYVTLVLALATAKLYRGLVGDRARFEQWQVKDQTQNISVNELMQMVSNADRQADDEWAALKRWQKPVVGRI